MEKSPHQKVRVFGFGRGIAAAADAFVTQKADADRPFNVGPRTNADYVGEAAALRMLGTLRATIAIL